MILNSFNLGLKFQIAHTIRNSINPVDHMAAGFVLGAVFRTMGGPKAMLGKLFYQIMLIG